MQPTLAQAQLISQLVRSTQAMRVLELGIFSSYTTLAISLALPPAGRLVSCGVTGKHLDVSRIYWQQCGVADRIDFHIGTGLELLNGLLAANPVMSFDAIVISGLKYQYPQYYQRAIELLRPQGLAIATDVLWQGRVLNPDTYNDEFTRGLESFNRQLASDPSVLVTVLPIGDGLSIVTKL